MRSEKPISSPLRLSEVPPTLPLTQFQCPSAWTMALSRPFKEERRALAAPSHASSPGDRWCDVLGFVPVGSVSSSSTLQIFRDVSHL